ncbi:MAG TPA: glutaredoxin domain-containing protein [Anaerolineales bacterium]|nr:glutaredoxin domain-containing protein [Anaerolineales bacterium]
MISLDAAPFGVFISWMGLDPDMVLYIGKEAGICMQESKIIVYGTCWCGDCYRARKFLDQNRIAYEWIDIDRNADGEKLVLKINHGMRSVPTILFEDGSVLVEPSNQDLVLKLKLA